jgi:hypothetical protein
MDWIHIGMKLLFLVAAALGTVFLCYRSVMDTRQAGNMRPYYDEPEEVDGSEATEGQHSELEDGQVNGSNSLQSSYWERSQHDTLSHAGT